MSPIRVDARRRDRSKDEPFIRAVLEQMPWGTLAISGGDGPPHLNTNIFVYRSDPDRIYVHTARLGTLADGVRAGGPDGVAAAFTTGSMGRLLPADEALEFSVEYASATATGRLTEVADPDEAGEALQWILDRYAPHLRPGRDYREVVPEELKRTAVFRLDVETWSGKQKAVGDHPGAFGMVLPLPPLEV